MTYHHLIILLVLIVKAVQGLEVLSMSRCAVKARFSGSVILVYRGKSVRVQGGDGFYKEKMERK